MRFMWLGGMFLLTVSLAGCGSSNSSEEKEAAAAKTACDTLFAKVDEICKADENSPGCQSARGLLAPIKDAKPDENACKALMAPVEAFGKASAAPKEGGGAPSGEETPEGSESAPTE